MKRKIIGIKSGKEEMPSYFFTHTHKKLTKFNLISIQTQRKSNCSVKISYVEIDSQR